MWLDESISNRLWIAKIWRVKPEKTRKEGSNSLSKTQIFFANEQ